MGIRVVGGGEVGVDGNGCVERIGVVNNCHYAAGVLLYSIAVFAKCQWRFSVAVYTKAFRTLPARFDWLLCSDFLLKYSNPEAALFYYPSHRCALLVHVYAVCSSNE